MNILSVSFAKKLQILKSFQRYSYNGTLQHPRYVVEQLNVLALSHMYKKDYAQSESILKKALKICEYHTINQTQNPWTPNLIVWTLNSLAKLEQSKKNLNEALKYIVRLNELNMDAFEKGLIPHNALVAGLCRLGEIHFDLENHVQAEKEFNKIIELDKKSANCVREKCCKTSALALLYIGKIELAKKNFEKARVLLERSWDLYRDLVGILNVHIYKVLFELAKAYQGIGDFARARTLLEYAGQGFESFLYDQEKVENVAQVWKEVISHLPGVTAPRSVGPFSGRHGINLYPAGESPEEDKKKKQQSAYKKKLISQWKKSHNIKKYESNE